MIVRDALYSFIENLINTSTGALANASSFRNIRSSVDDYSKVVRVEALDGIFSRTSRDMEKELGVQATIQCWASPAVADDSPDFMTYLDEATDLSFEMAREIFDGIADDPSLGGLVCVALFEGFETGEGKMANLRRGVTYLDGFINGER